MKKINNTKGIVFWVTGLPGSGKTSIAIKLKNQLKKCMVKQYYLVVMI